MEFSINYYWGGLMSVKNPRVFISHASEDKERFVLDFGEKLRSKGVDAWIDKWEMHPGDSLVNKIFEEGIGQSDVVIIVLSENSIRKTWVIEELNAATIRRIEENVRIIPVIINDFVSVPTSLNHLLRVRITDLNNYKDEFHEILNGIYNIDKKPPLGETPEYVDFHTVSGLTAIDSVVLKTIGDISIENGPHTTLVPEKIIKKLEHMDISKNDIIDSIEILGSQYYLKITRVLAGLEHSPFSITTTGLMIYCQNFVPNFLDQFKNVVSTIINDNLRTDDQICSQTGYPNAIVNGILEHLGNLKYIQYPKVMSGNINISKVTPTGKRYFKEVLD